MGRFACAMHACAGSPWSRFTSVGSCGPSDVVAGGLNVKPESMQRCDDEGLRRQFVPQQWVVLEPALGADCWAVARNPRSVFRDSVGSGANLLEHGEAASVVNDVVGVNGMPELRARFAQAGRRWERVRLRCR